MPGQRCRTLSSTTFRYSVFIMLALALPLGTYWIYESYTTCSRDVKAFEEKCVEQQKDDLRSEIQDLIRYMDYMKSRTEDLAKEDVRNKVHEAHAMAARLYDACKDRMNPNEIQEMVREALRQPEPDSGRARSFVTSIDNVEKLLADESDGEGKNSPDSLGSDTASAMRDMVEIARDQGEGFYSYIEKSPEGENEVFPKIAFVKYFEPFDWIIGSTVYIDDAEEETRKEVIRRIRQASLGNHGYFFACDSNGVCLVHPDESLIGRDMFGFRDSDGKPIVAQLLQTAENGGGFVRYQWPREPGSEPIPKLCYAEKFEPWGWIIGTGVYMEDLADIMAMNRANMTSQIFRNAARVVVFVLVASALALIISLRFSNRVTREIRVFESFFEQAAAGRKEIDEDSLLYEELRGLASSANTMLARQRRAEEALENRSRLERALAACSQSLLSDSDNAVNEALTHLLDISGVSRVYIFENFEEPGEGLCMRQVYEACAEGVEPEIGNPVLQRLPYDPLCRRWRERLAVGKEISGLVESFPAAEREILEPQGVLSLVAIPITVQGKWYGFIGFDDIRRRREWEDDSILLLRTAAEMIGAFIERRQAKLTLAIEREQLLSIFDSIGDSIYVSDPVTHEVLYANEVLRSMLKTDPVGKTCYIELQGRDVPCEFCTNEAILRNGGKPHRWEYHNSLLDRNFMIVDRIIKWPDGRDVRFEIAMDITEVKRANEEKAILSTAIEQISDYIVIADSRGKVQFANPAFETVTGRSRDSIIGHGMEELLQDSSGDSTGPNIWEAVSSEGFWKGRIVRERDTGEQYQEEMTVSPVKDSCGEIVHYVIVARDVSDLASLEAQLRQSQKMEAIGTLAGGIAHDFNNMLAPILGYTDMTMNELPEGDLIRTNLEQVLNAAMRAKELVKHILTFSRQEERCRKALMLHPIVKETLKLLTATFPSTIEIRQSIDGNAGYVLAEPAQMHQVLMNLCTNAFHAMKARSGILTVELDSVDCTGDEASKYPGLEKDGYVRLSVSDTGEGMSKGTLERIFEPFFTTKAVGEGTGLGLSVVHGIVTGCGGKIEVSSEVGKGSRFDLYFPRASVPVDPEQHEDNSVEGGSERILLVDDEETITTIFSKMLGRIGYTVTTTTSSLEALEMFRREPDRYDLVVTDQTMPVMTGGELSTELMKIRPDIAIVLMTGFSESLSVEDAQKIGIREYVMKPVLTGELSRAIRRALETSRV